MHKIQKIPVLYFIEIFLYETILFDLNLSHFQNTSDTSPIIWCVSWKGLLFKFVIYLIRRGVETKPKIYV